MKGSESKLVAFMDGSDKKFVIPVYQRNYDWKIEQCKQLFDDLLKINTLKRKSHFFGSIVSVYNDGELNEFLVIDGQQRLTTVSLLLLSMCNAIQVGDLIPNNPGLADKIYETYLINKWETGDKKFRLYPVKNDREAFVKLFDRTVEPIRDSNMTINYDYFYNRIKQKEISVDQLFDAITKLEIINITLNKDDNPQLIFESLNSTGLALSEGDRIRNFVLMGLTPRKQESFYEKYWNRIEVYTNYDVSMFVRDYLSVKEQQIPSINRIYITFKSFVEETKVEIEPLLQELLSYAEWYSILLTGTKEDKELNSCIYRLNRLETTVTRPFFLEVLRLWKTGSLPLNDVKEIFLNTENYLFRRAICDLPSNGLNKVFLMMHQEIIRFDGTDENYLEKFKYALNNIKQKARFPDDNEFVSSLSARQVYKMNSKNKVYLLERMENAGTVEVSDVYKMVDDGTYSIEHIMPQQLNHHWIKELGDDHQMIHETWLHRLANLTLTGYNSKYSNNAFVDKCNMEHGFRHSHIHLNKWIGEQEHWSLKELEERNDILMHRALTIWKIPVSNYKPATKQTDAVSLEFADDLTNRKITRFSYKNSEQTVKNWNEMMEQVIKLLHSEDKSVLFKLAYSNEAHNDLKTYVSNNQDDLRKATEIEPGIFFESNTSTQIKLSLLRRLFKVFNISASELILFLKEEKPLGKDEAEVTEK